MRFSHFCSLTRVPLRTDRIPGQISQFPCRVYRYTLVVYRYTFATINFLHMCTGTHLGCTGYTFGVYRYTLSIATFLARCTGTHKWCTGTLCSTGAFLALLEFPRLHQLFAHILSASYWLPGHKSLCTYVLDLKDLHKSKKHTRN